MSDVISLNKKREEKGQNTSETVATPKEENFAEIMRRNAENAARMKKEREKANKCVIRSYRLKH